MTKSTGNLNFPTLTNTFSHIPKGYLTDLSASWMLIWVCFNPEYPNFWNMEYGIRLMLAPKSARAFLTDRDPMEQGKVKLPGSSTFFGSPR